MAERRANPGGETRPTSRVRAQRVRDYEQRVRELTEAFVLPPDLRRWVTVRLDDDEGTEDVISVAAQGGRTNTVLAFPLPAGLARELRAFLEDHQEELDHRLKLDMATNLMAMMTQGPGGGDDE